MQLTLENKNKPLFYWLISGCLLIFLMVIIGGITRLTNSGLSMVEWKLIMGIIPPLNEAEWLKAFEKYKQFPEYQIINTHFTLAEFQSIFFWEYLHRLLGRVIGLVFIIPFFYFLIKKRLNKKLLIQTIILLIMGSLQGFFGWWMVKSGLVKNPDVSHYRLALHLITAFLTFAYTFWVALGLIENKNSNSTNVSSIKMSLIILLFVLIIQLIYGAFVAGLNAGFIINTWPKMENEWIHQSVFAIQPIWKNFIEGLAGVQFIHRYIAFIIVGLVLFSWFKAIKNKLNNLQLLSLRILLGTVLMQFLLGVFTLIYAVPIWLGVTHQIGAFLLLGATVFGIFSFKKLPNN